MRSGFGYVPQDVFLFSDTIANNIAFGSEHDTPSLTQIRTSRHRRRSCG